MTPRRGPIATTLTPTNVTVSAAFVVLAALVPFVYPSVYGIGVLVGMLILIILNLSWNFLLGFSGVWNFGQLALYAAGGYGAGLLVIHLSVPPWLAIAGGGLAGAAVAVVLALPTLRLYAIYTSLLTFAAAEVLQLTIENDSSGFTGGSFGLPSVKGLFGSFSPLWSTRWWYWLCLTLVTLTAVGVAILVRSPLGLALRTLRDSASYGSARGISPLRYRVIGFAISGAIAGVAGGLYTVFNGSISPDIMGLTPLSIYVTMIVVGGLGSVTGPIIGTVLLTVIEQALVDHPATEYTVLGLVLLVIVVFFPRGLASEAAKVQQRVVAWVDEGAGDVVDDRQAVVAAPEQLTEKGVPA